MQQVNKVGDASTRLKPVEIYKEVLSEAISRLVIITIFLTIITINPILMCYMI